MEWNPRKQNWWPRGVIRKRKNWLKDATTSRSPLGRSDCSTAGTAFWGKGSDWSTSSCPQMGYLLSPSRLHVLECVSHSKEAPDQEARHSHAVKVHQDWHTLDPGVYEKSGSTGKLGQSRGIFFFLLDEMRILVSRDDSAMPNLKVLCFSSFLIFIVKEITLIFFNHPFLLYRNALQPCIPQPCWTLFLAFIFFKVLFS